MKKIILLSIVTLFTFQLSFAQKLKGNKNVIIENRETDDFSTIVIKDKLKVFITESTDNNISVETDENLQIAVETRVNNGVLEVYLSHEISRKKELNIYIGVNDSIKRIEAYDYASITSDKEVHISDLEIFTKDHASVNLIINANSISVKADDKSDLELTLNAMDQISISLEQKASLELQCISNNINAILADDTSIDIKGNTKNLILKAESSASFEGKELFVDTAKVSALGKASLYLNILNEVTISAEDDADIYLYANPKIIINKFSDKSTLYKK